MTPPAFFNKIANIYDPLTHLYMYGTYHAVRRRILNLHREVSHEVLDICCGTGYVSNHVPARRVVGIDLSIPMLTVNQRNQKRLGNGAYLINGNIRRLPFSDKQFNEVYFTLAAHEFPDLVEVLKEVFRVMAADGRLVIYDLYEPKNPLLRLFLNSVFYYLVEQRCMWLYSVKGWRELLEGIGFQMENLIAPYGLSALVSAIK